MATAASSPRTPTITTSTPEPTATSTKRIRTATGASGTTVVGLPSIPLPRKPRLRPTSRTKKPAIRPQVLRTTSAPAPAPAIIPAVLMAAPVRSAAPAKLRNNLPPNRPVRRAPWGSSKTMRVPVSVALSSNKTATPVEYGRLAAPLAAGNVAARRSLGLGVQHKSKQLLTVTAEKTFMKGRQP
jgi:hypothetical protein